MREGSYLSLGPDGFHRVCYAETGPPDGARVLVCVHGLTRNASDFHALAQALSDVYRVVCVDVVGRGASDWLRRPEGYGYPVYCADMAALVARLGASEVDWLGTSMGGLIGMMLAAQPGTPIRRLVVNDIGPFIPQAAQERIFAYVGGDPRFDTLAALDAHLRQIYAPFAPFTPAQWDAFVRASARQGADGRLALAYDPAIAVALRAAPPEDVDLWATWDRVSAPTLVLRGALSDVLLPATAEEMTRRGPRADLEVLDGAGHAPTLLAAAQISVVRDWLLAT